MTELFTRPDPAERRADRVHGALAHLVERHAATPEHRSRQVHPAMAAPHEMVRLVAGLAGGSIPVEPGEPGLDTSDLLAALTLLPEVRAELDAIELQLLTRARNGAMTGPERSDGAGHHGLSPEVVRPERSGGRMTGPERSDGAGHHGLSPEVVRPERSGGRMTWQDIAFGLGLNSPQAARQRYERLEARADEA
ncbi:hypothetical protein ABT297_41220 [Dactylosporangium sp. NPDC000555]|uniref:hypothetical protein n=1 Tax=Dactylosporangium sp. NPDC000555 TaxID=3154260 RepID=UPI00332FF6F8